MTNINKKKAKHFKRTMTSRQTHTEPDVLDESTISM